MHSRARSKSLVRRMDASQAAEMDELLQCSVCLERFDDPRTLPCNHNFCRTCLEKIPRNLEDRDGHIVCPCCRRRTSLPAGGVADLIPAFVVNGMLSVRLQIEDKTIGNTDETLSCQNHDEMRIFFCKTCDALLCPLCAKPCHNNNHDCVHVPAVATEHREKIEQNLALLAKDMTRVDSIIAQVDSAEERLNYQGDKVRKVISETVEEPNRKTKLISILNQNIEEKLDALNKRREDCTSAVKHMDSCMTNVKEQLKKLKDNGEISAVKNDLLQMISVVRSNSVLQATVNFKFMSPSEMHFSLESASMLSKMKFLFELTGDQGGMSIVAGKKCSLHVFTDSDYQLSSYQPVRWDLVPSNSIAKPSESYFCSLGKGKVLFTPSQVGYYDLVLYTTCSSQCKPTTLTRILVSSPLLLAVNQRYEVSKHDFISKFRAFALNRVQDVIVCAEPTSDSITVFENPAGKWNKLLTISSLGSTKKCLNKPCCVGVTPDNCLIVVDSGKQCYRLLKIKMDGKLIAHDLIKDKLLSPNALAVHPCGKIFVVDSGAHSVTVFNKDLTFCNSIGSYGKAGSVLDRLDKDTLCQGSDLVNDFELLGRNCRGFFDQPHSVAFDSKGHIYISDSGNNRIQKLAMEGGNFKVDVFVHKNGSELKHFTQPTALCISCYDTVFVLVNEPARIAAFDTQGHCLVEVSLDTISVTKPYAMVTGREESYLCVLDEACYVIQ